MTTEAARSYTELTMFTDTTESLLGKDIEPVSPFFGIAHILRGDKDEVRAYHRRVINDSAAEIVANFDPNTVIVDETRDGSTDRHGVGVKAVGTDSFTGTNPLYDMGLPNAFVGRDSDDRAELDLIYIPYPYGWSEHVSIPPPPRPAVHFLEQADGNLTLDLTPWVHPGFELPLRQSERFARAVQVIGNRLCSEELRPHLIVYTNSWF